MKRVIKIAFAFYFILLNYSANAQVFQPKELKSELDTLLKIVDKVHPDPYNYVSKEDFRIQLYKLRDSIVKPMSDYQFYLKVSTLITLLNDGHTYLGLNNSLEQRSDSCLQFPFTIKIDKEKIFLKTSYCIHKNLEGAELLYINGVSSIDVINNLKSKLQPTINNAQKEKIISRLFYTLFPTYFSFPRSYQLVVCKNDERYMVNIEKSDVNHDITTSYQRSTNKNLHLYILANKTAILKIPSFGTPRFMEFDTIFKQLKDSMINHLIIDVRGNPGGHSWNVDSLMSYLTSSTYKGYDSIISKISFKSQDYINTGLSQGNGIIKGDCFYVTSSIIREVAPLKKANCYKGQIYVLIDDLSYSAATIFSNIIKCYSIGKLFGEETVQKTTFCANNDPVILPLTKIPFYISSDKAVLPCSVKERGVIPDYLISSDLDSNEDKVLNFTLDLIKNKK